MKKIALYLLIATFCNNLLAQVTGPLGKNIHSVKLYKPGDQTTFPILMLNSSDVLELHFDDLDAGVKNYYYSFQLCNADWTPSMLTTFEYTKGFQNVRISNYRNSSLSTTRYTHYQATLPDRSSYPTRSGNYLLKVFLNGDTSKLAFTRRFVIVDRKTSITAEVQRPFNQKLFKTDQKLQIGIKLDERIQSFNPTDLKVVVLQNKNWLTSRFFDRPTIYRGNYFEYSDEEVTSMPASKEFRWVDLRSFRLRGDKVHDIKTKNDSTFITVKPDPSRKDQVYIYYNDLNGSFTLEALENINPFWQSDYAEVKFSFFPPGNKPYEGKDLYLFGEMTNYAWDNSGKMEFNKERGAYEKSLLLKQGYYNYNYAVFPADKKGYPDFSETEGNYYETENSYIILVYYRHFGARVDELIGFNFVSSILHRQ
ncbi:DUF5103 domain-containing protein [Chitinophagaceae bacterium LB-8]|uniref:DUF5103 domain-containing protein n=1 Tax=Paraflavisolibacter caeni TaxID=2982496 RepID=A0A9X2XV29_9BACT|nr:DUF5103 domain-containing protein [Paraflavisolibacter caeni]MCU7549465.1 DUF5103 domain-containing protein [Paraflavisolibacter caeni]